VNKKTFKLDESDFVEVAECSLCGGTHRQALRTQQNISIYTEIYPKYSLVVPDSFAKRELLRCQDCGLVYWGRIPKFEALPSYQAEISDYGFDETRAVNKKAKLLNELLTGDELLVDIGACRGELLSAIRNINSNAALLGIEPSFEISNEKDNIRVIQALFNAEAPLEPNAVSVFSAFDVFEHLPRLDEAFSAIDLFLKKNGYVYIETPDGDYSFNHVIGNNNMNLFWIEHFSFLTRESIAYICNKYKYEAILIENVGHIETGCLRRFKSMTKTWILNKIFKKNNPMYVNSSDHLRIILKKI
jgi:hypothetical protein